MTEFAGMHETVLLDEAVELLVTKPSGIYVDATFGRGGHSNAILKVLSGEGRLIAFDKDVDALKEADKVFSGDARFEIVHGSFADIDLMPTARFPASNSTTLSTTVLLYMIKSLF